MIAWHYQVHKSDYDALRHKYIQINYPQLLSSPEFAGQERRDIILV
jgi:hypothetical protein